MASLSEANFELNEFSIEYLPDPIMVETLHFVFKLQTTAMASLRALCKDRMELKHL